MSISRSDYPVKVQNHRISTARSRYLPGSKRKKHGLVLITVPRSGNMPPAHNE